MATLILIDGPLTSETRSFPGVPPTLDLRIPERTTWCGCNPKQDAEPFKLTSEIVRYYCVARGDKVGIYSVRNEEEAVVHSLKEWVITDMSGPWSMGCRDRRAFK